MPSVTISFAAPPTSVATPPLEDEGAQLLPIAVRTVPRCSVWSMVRVTKVAACARVTGSLGLNVVGLVPCVMLVMKASRMNGQNPLDEGTSVNGPQIAPCARTLPVCVGRNTRRTAPSRHGIYRRFSIQHLCPLVVPSIVRVLHCNRGFPHVFGRYAEFRTMPGKLVSPRIWVVS